MEHGGAVLASTIDKYCYVINHNGRVWRFTDLPERAGLGSSSAYTVGWLRAITDHDQSTIAKLALDWERDKLSGDIGYQDQWLCALGGFRLMHFKASGVTSELITPREDLLEHLMLFDTGIYRYAGKIVQEQLKHVKKHESILGAMTKLVFEGVDIIQNKDRNILDFGYLLNESWQLKRMLSKKISTPVIDEFYQSAISAGAIGGKILGAGGGGFMLFFASPDKQEGVKKALGGLTYVAFRFEESGTQIIFSDRS